MVVTEEGVVVLMNLKGQQGVFYSLIGTWTSFLTKSHLDQSSSSVMVKISQLEKLIIWTIKNPDFVQHFNLKGNVI